MSKITNKSYLGYSGRVKIKIRNGDKVVGTIATHNAGELWLFKVLAAALCGTDERSHMPRYIDAGFTDNSTTSYETNLAIRPNLTGKKVKKVFDGENNLIGYSASFTAVIPYSSLRNSTDMMNTLKLSGSSEGNDEYLATVITQPFKLEDSRYSILLEWTMEITNQNEED